MNKTELIKYLKEKSEEEGLKKEEKETLQMAAEIFEKEKFKKRKELFLVQGHMNKNNQKWNAIAEKYGCKLESRYMGFSNKTFDELFVKLENKSVMIFGIKYDHDEAEFKWYSFLKGRFEDGYNAEQIKNEMDEIFCGNEIIQLMENMKMEKLIKK